MKSNVCVSLLLYLCASIAVNAAERANIMGMTSGSVLLSSSGEYGGGWMALNLLDGTTQRGWCSPQNKTAPHTFVIELPQRYRLSSIVLDNTDAQESGYPGISARSVELWGSNVGPDSGYQKIATLEAAKGARKARKAYIDPTGASEPYVFRYEAPDREFKVEVKFKKSSISAEELFEALSRKRPLEFKALFDIVGSGSAIGEARDLLGPGSARDRHVFSRAFSRLDRANFRGFSKPRPH